MITIKGERREESTVESEKQHRVESVYGSFSRSFALPADVDESGIRAESKDGVLRVHLPKTEVKKAQSHRNRRKLSSCMTWLQAGDFVSKVSADSKRGR